MSFELRNVRKGHLNLVACVSTVTEKPNSPEVFLQLEYTWYLGSSRTT